MSLEQRRVLPTAALALLAAAAAPWASLDGQQAQAEVLEAGANYVHGVQFRTTELRGHRDKARAMALRAARDKAQMMVRELGRTVGEPLVIREDHSGWWSWYGGWWGGRGGQAMAQNVVQNPSPAGGVIEGTTAPGQISVTARVTVTFDLVE